MIRKAEELSVAYNEHMRGGDGTVIVRKFIRGPEDLCGKGRLFANITLNPGCGIGFHRAQATASRTGRMRSWKSSLLS